MRKLLLAVSLLASSVAMASPDVKAPLSSWQPIDQWSPEHTHGYESPAGQLLFADEMGDKLSEIGRANLIVTCFERADAKAPMDSLIAWTVCGTDVRAFDLQKLAKELADSKAPKQDVDEITAKSKKFFETALAVGKAIDAAAKDDPGVQKILKFAEDGKIAWNNWLGTHKAEFARYLQFKDGVRSGKSNDPMFKGCAEAVLPAWQKHVREVAKKIPWDVDSDVVLGYMPWMMESVDGYIQSVTWAACAWSINEAGGTLYAASASTKATWLRGGWRTIALSWILDRNFAPKFADRSITWRVGSEWTYGVSMQCDKCFARQTPTSDVIGKIVVEGDTTKIVFKAGTAEACLNWKETKKIQSHAVNGDPIYERVCTKRGAVENDAGTVPVPTKFLAGAKPGDSLTIVSGYPVVSWKGKKLTSLFSVALK